MTEDEAKTRWCPFARTQQPEGLPANRFPDGTFGASRCIGSACMAWRAVHSTSHRVTLTIAEGEIVDAQGGQPRQGYCGLAGSAGA